jgi:transcriptional regulator with XRE-family HTH domain
MNIIGENVRRLRKLNQYNQVEFANLIGVSQGSLSDIEAGKSKPAMDTVVSIHEKLGCSIEWLLTGKGNKNLTDSENDKSTNYFSKLTPLEDQVVKALSELDYADQIEILEIIQIKLRKKGKSVYFNNIG